MSSVVSETPPVRPGSLAGRLRQLLRDLRQIPSAIRASVGHRLAPAVKKMVTVLGPRLPARLTYGLTDLLYSDNRKYLGDPATLAFATARFNRLTDTGARAGEGRRALVLLLRGQLYYHHNLHNYIIGCALRELGYRVGFIVCKGGVESCGIRQSRSESPFGPPEACGYCRGIVDNIAARGFDIISLNDYITPDEGAKVEQAAAQFEQEGADYQFDGIPVLNAMRPFLLRFFRGDHREIRPDNEEVRSHLRSGIRFMLRYSNLLDQMKPSCVSFFNGLFFPESLLFQEARRRGIPSLFAERGMRRDSLFLSVDEPACHYRSDRLWEELKDTLTGEQARAAAAYLAQRMAGPEDPTGTKRDLTDAAQDKYLRLAESPYVLLFAPVVHDTASMEKEGSVGDFYESLKLLAALAVTNRKRLVVRAHPDEMGANNPSSYTVRQYMSDHNLLDGEYVLCLDSSEKWNPYRLAEFSDAIVVYNGTLGMELPALGYEIFNLAASNYTGKGFTSQVSSEKDLQQVFRANKRRLSAAQMELALKYLYYYVYVANISLDSLLNEAAPFHFVLAEGAEGQQKEQLRSVKERLAFLLESPRESPAESTVGLRDALARSA
ncbi:MAG: hypothetical protein QOH49_1463 [Acidobacteriota bacterium]|jgi:hypothetical protein|nr:hypothetical protein [Acidobacteriota bacterium]